MQRLILALLLAVVLSTAHAQVAPITPENVRQIVAVQTYGTGIPLRGAVQPGGAGFALVGTFGVQYYRLSAPDLPETFGGDVFLGGDLAFSADGAQLAVVSFYSIHRYDIEIGAALVEYPDLGAGFTRVAYRPDSLTVAVGLYDDVGAVALLDAATLAPRQTFPTDIGVTTALAYDPAGGRLVVGSESGAVAVMDAETGQIYHRLEGHTAAVTDIQFSADGFTLYTTSDDGTVRVYSLPDGTFAQSLDLASFDDPTPDEMTLSIQPNLVTLTDSAAAVTLEYPFLEGVNALALTDDGETLILAGGAPIGLYYQLDGALVANFFMAESPVTVLAASPDGTRVVASVGAAGLSELSVFDGAGSPTGVINGIPFEVTAAAFSPDGARLLLGLADGSVETYDAETLEFIESVALHDGAVRALAISADGQYVATGSDDSSALVWNAGSGEVVTTLEGHSAPVLGVGFSPDGASLVTGGRDNIAYVWSLADGVQTAVLGEHYGAVTSVSVSPDGALILTTADDGAVRLYDALAGGDPLIAFYDHNAPVNVGAWLPDGLGFITGGGDGFARRYEVVR